MTECICGFIAVGMTITTSRNLNEDCPEHGIGTKYYKELMEKHNIRLRQLYAQVAEARKKRKDV